MGSHLKLILFFYLRYCELRERVYKPNPPLNIRELEAMVQQFRRSRR